MLRAGSPTLALAHARVSLILNNEIINQSPMTVDEVHHSSIKPCENNEKKQQVMGKSHLSGVVISFEKWRCHLTLCHHGRL